MKTKKFLLGPLVIFLGLASNLSADDAQTSTQSDLYSDIERITARAPDLVVRGIRNGHPYQVERGGLYGVSVTAHIRNAGSAATGVFKVSFAHNLASINDATDGPEASWFLPVHVFVRNLNPGETRAVTAIVKSRQSWFVPGIDVIVVADSCMGDAGFPRVCRVGETNERNNFRVQEDISL